MSFISTKAEHFFNVLLWMFVCPIKFISNLLLSDLAIRVRLHDSLRLHSKTKFKLNIQLELHTKFLFFLEGVLGKKSRCNYMFPVVLYVVAVDVHVTLLIGRCHDNVSGSHVFVEIRKVRDSSSHTYQQHVLQGAKRSYETHGNVFQVYYLI